VPKKSNVASGIWLPIGGVALVSLLAVLSSTCNPTDRLQCVSHEGIAAPWPGRKHSRTPKSASGLEVGPHSEQEEVADLKVAFGGKRTLNGGRNSHRRSKMTQSGLTAQLNWARNAFRLSFPDKPRSDWARGEPSWLARLINR
jgi:hypothetical protein